MDEKQFTYCSTFCAMFPSAFLWFERVGKVMLRWVVGKTWPTDKHMHVSFDAPHVSAFPGSGLQDSLCRLVGNVNSKPGEEVNEQMKERKKGAGARRRARV